MLTGLAVVLGAVAWLLTGWAGLVWVLVSVLLMGARRPRVPIAWVLSMYRAQPLPRRAAPRLHEVVDVLAVRAQLHRRPRVFYIATPTATRSSWSGRTTPRSPSPTGCSACSTGGS
jgi:heat shock protein HtpX